MAKKPKRKVVATKAGNPLDRVRSVKVGLYLDATDVAGVTLQRQADKFKLPTGKTIDVVAMLARCHRLLSQLGKIVRVDEQGNIREGGTNALEAKRREDALMARLKREEFEKSLVPAEIVEGMFARIATRMRQAGEKLQARYGAEAGDLLRQSLAEAQADIDEGLSRIPSPTEVMFESDNPDPRLAPRD